MFLIRTVLSTRSELLTKVRIQGIANLLSLGVWSSSSVVVHWWIYNRETPTWWIRRRSLSACYAPAKMEVGTWISEGALQMKGALFNHGYQVFLWFLFQKSRGYGIFRTRTFEFWTCKHDHKMMAFESRKVPSEKSSSSIICRKVPVST